MPDGCYFTRLGDIMKSMRTILQWLVVSIAWAGLACADGLPTKRIPTDKTNLISLLDKSHIDVDIPSMDETPDAISVRVNGSEVTGTEGGMIVFRFTPRGALTGIIVWNERMSNERNDP
jgi:hypothetical protein